MSVTYEPIGKVMVQNGRYYLKLEEKYMEAALGIEEFSHIQVLWWMNLYDSEECRNYFITEKPYVHGPERIGVLATRSPIRPNPIGLTACALINVDREQHTLEVGYMDGEDGTPILDIKPYEPSDDRIMNVTMPDWCSHWPKSLEEGEDFDWSKEFNFPS